MVSEGLAKQAASRPCNVQNSSMYFAVFSVLLYYPKAEAIFLLYRQQLQGKRIPAGTILLSQKITGTAYFASSAATKPEKFTAGVETNTADSSASGYRICSRFSVSTPRQSSRICKVDPGTVISTRWNILPFKSIFQRCMQNKCRFAVPHSITEQFHDSVSCNLNRNIKFISKLQRHKQWQKAELSSISEAFSAPK